MLHNPKLLLLDQPTAGVDPKARREFWDRIHELSSHGLTFLIATHYMDEAERCHRLAFILNGRLIVHGTAGEVIEKAHLTTWAVSGPDLLSSRADSRSAWRGAGGSVWEHAPHQRCR